MKGQILIETNHHCLRQERPLHQKMLNCVTYSAKRSALSSYVYTYFPEAKLKCLVLRTFQNFQSFKRDKLRKTIQKSWDHSKSRV